LQLAEVNEPTISIIDNPQQPRLKLLVFQGKDEAQLEQAVLALVWGNPVFSGDKVIVKGVKAEARAAYDVPRWLRSDRAVKLSELVNSVDQLQATGIAPPPINVNLRLPPDLFIWNRTGVPFDLRYRYHAPITTDNSTLSISINNQLLRAYRLRAEDDAGSGGKLRIPLLSSSDTQQRDALVIPAFQLASNNQMQFQFALQYHRDELCRDVFADPTREAIDPDSTIDISDFAHYTALPNLALFANAGFPFTRYADLSQTALVLPDVQKSSLEQLFFVLGRFGRHTGAAATRYQLLDVEHATQAKQVDLLLLAGEASNQLLLKWGKTPSLRINDGERIYREGVVAPSFFDDPLHLSRSTTPDNEVNINANGSLGALIGFESPLSADRSVVALTASDATATTALLNTLEDDGKVAMIRGDLTIVRGSDVQSYQGDELYYVGSLSWWMWLWFYLSRHPILLTLLAIFMAVTVALLGYGWLQRRLQQRMASDVGKPAERA
jgi:cellulose synthase operon protein B